MFYRLPEHASCLSNIRYKIQLCFFILSEIVSPEVWENMVRSQENQLVL